MSKKSDKTSNKTKLSTEKTKDFTEYKVNT